MVYIRYDFRLQDSDRGAGPIFESHDALERSFAFLEANVRVLWQEHESCLALCDLRLLPAKGAGSICK